MSGALVQVNDFAKSRLGGSNAERKLSAAHANGAVSIFSLNEDDQLELLHEWKETRIRADQSFIGLAASGSGVHVFKLFT
jgi:hypothetical protein